MKSPAWLTLVAFVFISPAAAVEVLPGTQPLTWDGDISLKMVDDLHAFADRETAASVQRRTRHWKRWTHDRELYDRSVSYNREQLSRSIGIQIAESPRLEEVHAVDDPNGAVLLRWRAFDDVYGYAYHLSADSGKAKANVVIILDPEFTVGGKPVSDAVEGIVELLHGADCSVYVTWTIDRRSTLSETANGLRKTDQTHREFIYRQAFEMGRHLIGYEAGKILSLVENIRAKTKTPIGLLGFGEGGNTALIVSALDSGIESTAACGASLASQEMWREPIDRNIWGYLDQFGGAELLSLIAPRHVVLWAPDKAGFKLPEADEERSKVAAPGTLRISSVAELTDELKRATAFFSDKPDWLHVDIMSKITDPSDETNAFNRFLAALDTRPSTAKQISDVFENQLARLTAMAWDENERRILNDLSVTELIDYTQALVRESEYVRKEWWKNADRASRDPEKWKASLKPYRDHLYDEVLGRFDLPKLPPNARTRKVYDEPKYAGYEVVLDVFGADAEHVDVWAYGILLVPKDIKAGERRPVVVCQHGLEGRPQDVATPGLDHRAYHGFANKLAERGFVVFAPQNPYIGKDHFRQLVRKLYPLKKTLWSVIVPQHEQITDWLASLPFVDGERIGFYGLSYGGKTAMRVPALVERYCLSICSGDFNEWIRKCTSVRDTFSYMGTHEYEMYEFDLGHTFNYAEMAYLIAPRPFMVERGHRDGVGIDEWVSYEYAKVRLLYADLKIPERTEIEYFDGPHEIHGVGTFAFLHKHLKWPEPAAN